MAAGSEGKSGNSSRWTSGALDRLNATIWRGIKNPEGERRSVRRFGTSGWNGFGEGPVDMEQAGREH
jgi:hypothetical protein